MTFVVHMHDRLDAQHGADDRGRGAHASAALQEHQIVDRKPVADVQLQRFGIIAQLVDRHARFLLFMAEIYEKTFAQRRAQ